MKRFRFQFSLVSVLIAVTAVAAGCVSLAFASPMWSSAVFTICVGLLVFSGLAAIIRGGECRARWMGVLLVGATYLLIVFGPFSGHVKSRLLTTRILEWSHGYFESSRQADAEGTVTADFIIADVIDDVGSPDIMVREKYTAIGEGLYRMQPANSNIALLANVATRPSWDEFHDVGQSLFVLLFALVGGYVGSLLFRAQRNSESKGTSES